MTYFVANLSLQSVKRDARNVAWFRAQHLAILRQNSLLITVKK